MRLDQRSSMVVLTIVVMGLAFVAGLVIPLASGGSQGGAAPTGWAPPPTASATAVRPTSTARPTVTTRAIAATSLPATVTPTRQTPTATPAPASPTLRPTAAPTQTATRAAITQTATLAAATATLTAAAPPKVTATTVVTPTVTARPAPASGAPVAQVREGPLTLRTSPSRDGGVVAMAQVGEVYTATARTADSGWLQVCCIQGSPVWLSAQYVTITGTLSALPIKP